MLYLIVLVNNLPIMAATSSDSQVCIPLIQRVADKMSQNILESLIESNRKQYEW